MVRKSSKTNAGDKPTRKRRGTRRRKDSSSESETEVNQPAKEENVSSIALPKDSKKEEGDEVESSSRRKRGSKRGATSKDDTSQEDSAVDNTTNEWNEDETFWSGVVAANAAGNNEVVNEDEGSTWKIQSSNGSGGEIQKLKICRQRPTDSTGSSSPAKECASPRMKSSSRISVPEKIDGENTELEADAPMDIVDVESDKIHIEQIPVVSASIEPELPELPPPIVEETAAVAPTSINSSSCTLGEMKMDTDEIIIPGLDLVSEGQKQQDQLWITPQPVTEVSMIEMPPAKEESLQIQKEVESSEEVVSNIEPTCDIQEEIQMKEEEELEAIKNINLPPVEEVNVVADITTKEEEVLPPEKPVLVSSPQDNTIVEEPDEKKPTSKCLAGTLPVSSELAMEQIAKKLNERAARGKELLDEKEKIKTMLQHSRENSPELDRSIEEGEILSSAAATPDPQPSSKTAKAATVVIKPKEVVCLPTKLKRNIEESPPEGRKRRVSKKRLCFSPQISITSDLLKELMPDELLQTVTANEDVEFGNESDVGEELPVQTEEIPEAVETENKKSSPPKFETKHDDVEVTVSVSDDVREVKKKVPIVITDTISPPANKGASQGPKLPTTTSTTTSSTTSSAASQENNHKAIRKISIVSADAKALRKSPSPSRKKATEVLYITNLVRPFTVPQLRELLARTGTIAQNGFYIDKIKSKCYVKYTDVEMAIETRHALHGVRWPVNNPKTLRVDFALPEDMAVVQKLADEEAGAAAKKQENDAVAASGTISGSGSGWLNEQAALKPSRRVTATVREWDMGKVVGSDTGATKTSPPIAENKKKTEDDWSRKKEKPSRPDKDRDRRRVHSPEHKAEPPKKMKKKEIDAPAKLLDDLFRKTKATPCIYWLPLTAAQIAVKEEIRRQHMAEHERRLAELRKTDASGSRRDNKERERERDRDRRKK